jgi:hypothetical protein
MTMYQDNVARRSLRHHTPNRRPNHHLEACVPGPSPVCNELPTGQTLTPHIPRVVPKQLVAPERAPFGEHVTISVLSRYKWFFTQPLHPCTIGMDQVDILLI